MPTKTLAIENFTPEELARLAGLHYVTDGELGFRRAVNCEGFYYLNGRGLKLRDRQGVRRITSLAIPPAWTDVWICRDEQGHLQGTGRDSRGRKQYIYHERWREISNFAKFWRMRHCVRFLPKLREQVQHDLRGRGLTQRRVLAGMVALLDLTSIRIGNEEYVRQNNSYGLATLRTRHVTIESGQAKLHFRGKGGQPREALVNDKRIVRLLNELKNLPGALVFQYMDRDGVVHRADSLMVNEYLRERTGRPFTAKDFRTWKASAVAARLLFDERDAEAPRTRKRLLNQVMSRVSEQLGNTPTICRKYYVHAGLQDAYLAGKFPQIFARYRAGRPGALSADERIFAHFLRRWPGQ